MAVNREKIPFCLQMRPIATGVDTVAWSVCLRFGHTGELCKTAEPIEMPFAGLKEP